MSPQLYNSLEFSREGLLLWVERHQQAITQFLLILLVTAFVSVIAARILRMFAQRNKVAQKSSILQRIIRAVIWGIGLLIALQSTGLSITPLLTAVGVGSLAVAFGLQDTIANMAAGFNVLVSKHIKIGDYIQLFEGPEGTVKDITWRYTIIEAVGNKTILIPNKEMVESIVTNFSIIQERTIIVPFELSYTNDFEKVEMLLKNIAVEVRKEVDPDAETKEEPVVRFGEFRTSGVECKIQIKTGRKTDPFKLKHELIKQIHAASRKKRLQMAVVPIMPTAKPTST